MMFYTYLVYIFSQHCLTQCVQVAFAPLPLPFLRAPGLRGNPEKSKKGSKSVLAMHVGSRRYYFFFFLMVQSAPRSVQSEKHLQVRAEILGIRPTMFET